MFAAGRSLTPARTLLRHREERAMKRFVEALVVDERRFSRGGSS